MSLRPVPCPVCGASDSRVLYTPWRSVDDPARLFGAASGERGTQTIVRCRAPRCGMVYASPRHDDALILEAYRRAEDDGHDTQFDSRVETFARSLRKLASRLPPPGGRALDVGCAGGAYLRAAQRYGYRASGLEPSARLAGLCRARGFDAAVGTLENYPPRERFDLVTLWDVLEHVTEPGLVLRKCRELLKPGGVLLVNYPDVGTWQARLAGKWFWWFLSVHLHYFDRRTIRLLLEKEGYEVVSTRRHVQVLEWGYLLDVLRIYSAPLSRFARGLSPAWLERARIPYYASQTTVLARPRP